MDERTGSAWLFGGQTPEEEAEEQRYQAFGQENLQYNLQRLAELRVEQAEERRREEDRRRDKERRLEEEKRNSYFQQQMKQRDQELAALRNRFEESQKPRPQPERRVELHKNIREEWPPVPVQQPRSNNTNPRHSSQAGRQHNRAQPQKDESDNPPSKVIFKKTKGFFNGLVGSGTGNLRQTPSILVICLIISVIPKKMTMAIAIIQLNY